MKRICAWTILALALILAVTACSKRGGPREPQDIPLFSGGGSQMYAVTLYDDINCFSLTSHPERVCANWRLAIRSDRNLVWSLELSDVASKQKLFADTLVLSPSARKGWANALTTALAWAQTAAREEVNIEKEIGTIDDKVRAVFVSRERGGLCEINFSHPGWTPLGMVYMRLTTAEGPLSGQSIETLLARLNNADEEIRDRQGGRKSKKALFE